MKRLMFMLVSAFMAATGFAVNVAESISAISSDNESTLIEKQKKQPFVLKKAVDMMKTNILGHGSHASHASHSSHRSHYSSR